MQVIEKQTANAVDEGDSKLVAQPELTVEYLDSILQVNDRINTRLKFRKGSIPHQDG